MKTKYNLVGINGNAFSVMGYVGNAIKREGKSKEDKVLWLRKRNFNKEVLWK